MIYDWDTWPVLIRHGRLLHQLGESTAELVETFERVGQAMRRVSVSAAQFSRALAAAFPKT